MSSVIFWNGLFLGLVMLCGAAANGDMAPAFLEEYYMKELKIDPEKEQVKLFRIGEVNAWLGNSDDHFQFNIPWQSKGEYIEYNWMLIDQTYRAILSYIDTRLIAKEWLAAFELYQKYSNTSLYSLFDVDLTPLQWYENYRKGDYKLPESRKTFNYQYTDKSTENFYRVTHTRDSVVRVKYVGRNELLVDSPYANYTLNERYLNPKDGWFNSVVSGFFVESNFIVEEQWTGPQGVGNATITGQRRQPYIMGYIIRKIPNSN